ncbi:MAG TPA: helix-turn-helix transcriptional regulator [Solirubrobacterales bacterium]
MDVGAGGAFASLMPRREEPQIGLSRAIRQLRMDLRLSQEALGLSAGIHPTWISHIESGRVNPTWGNVRRLATGLQVSLPELAALAEEFEARHANGTAPRPGSGSGGR